MAIDKSIRRLAQRVKPEGIFIMFIFFALRHGSRAGIDLKKKKNEVVIPPRNLHRDSPASGEMVS